MADKARKVRRVRIVVRGMVQGVGFRFFTEHVARLGGVGGWVRNRYDGSVEIEAEGDDEELDAFLREIRKGPRMSRVDDVVLQDAEPLGEKEFRIEASES